MNFKQINHYLTHIEYETIKRANNILAAFLIVFISFNSTRLHASDWINPTGGLYHDPSNWSAGVPIPDSGGVFNLSSTGYTVNFSQNAQTGTVQIINDNVTFDLGGNIFALQFSTSSASQIILGSSGTVADLTVQNGGLFTSTASTFATSGVRVADFTGATGTLTFDGLFDTIGIPGMTGWLHQGDFTIGGGANSTGTFNVINGAVVETGGGRVWVGKPNNASNSTILIDNAVWTHTDGATGGFWTGESTTASITIQNGGFLSTQGTTLGNGNLAAATTGTATVLVTGAGSTWQADTMTLGAGTLTVNNGSNVTTTGDMYIGDHQSLSSNFTVAVDGVGSSVNVGGNLTLGGSFGLTQGHLTVSNGANVTVSGNMSLNGRNNPSGSDVLVSGTNSALNVTGQLDLSQNASLTINNNGRVITSTLNVGSFSGGNEQLNVTGNGRIGATTINNYSGTINLQETIIQANVQNFNEINASGPADNLINGDVTNNGTIKTTDTTLTVTGTLTNNGVYISDPSDNIFGNLVVGSDGYLAGGLGDRFIVHGDFTNNSTQASLWDTGLSTLIFDTTGTHSLTLASDDFGIDGILDNFNWGVLQLESGAGLNLFDDIGDGAALYVGLLDLADGIDQLSLINSAFNIYYDESLTGNSYLNGQTISLAGGAILTPGTFTSTVPVPAAVWLFGSGLIGLIGLARRNRSSVKI